MLTTSILWSSYSLINGPLGIILNVQRDAMVFPLSHGVVHTLWVTGNFLRLILWMQEVLWTKYTTYSVHLYFSPSFAVNPKHFAIPMRGTKEKKDSCQGKQQARTIAPRPDRQTDRQKSASIYLTPHRGKVTDRPDGGTADNVFSCRVKIGNNL